MTPRGFQTVLGHVDALCSSVTPETDIEHMLRRMDPILTHPLSDMFPSVLAYKLSCDNMMNEVRKMMRLFNEITDDLRSTGCHAKLAWPNTMHWRDLRPHEISLDEVSSDEVSSGEEFSDEISSDEISSDKNDEYQHEGVLSFVAKFYATPMYDNATRLIIGHPGPGPGTRTRCRGVHFSYGEAIDVWDRLTCHMNCNMEHLYSLSVAELNLEKLEEVHCSDFFARYQKMISRMLQSSHPRPVAIQAFPVNTLLLEAQEFRTRVSMAEIAGGLAAQHGRYMPNNEGYEEAAQDYKDVASQLRPKTP